MNSVRGGLGAALWRDKPSRRRRRERPRFALLKGLLPLVVLLVIWQILGPENGLRFPRPSSWIAGLGQLNASGTLAQAFISSGETFALGLVVAVLIGMLLGLIIGASPRLEHALTPLLDFFRGVPVPVIIPVVILISGLSLWPTVFVVAFGTTWPVLLTTLDSRRSISNVRSDMARVLHLTRPQRTVKIVLPSVLPGALAGIRISASLAVITTLVVEMLGNNEGAGFTLMQAQARFESASMWGLLFLVGLFGFLLNYALIRMENYVMRNRPSRY